MSWESPSFPTNRVIMAEIDVSFEEQVAGVVDNFVYHANTLQLPPALTSALANSLRVSTLRQIVISGSKGLRLTDDQVGSFSHCILQSNILLECLALPYHSLTDAGLGYIATALMYVVPNPDDAQQGSMRLEVLDLEGNEITATGLHALRLHSDECPLLSINLSVNPLGLEGGKILAEALAVNRTLRQLLVFNCGFTQEATVAIATSLNKTHKARPVLEELQIDRPLLGSTVGEDAVDHFSRVVANTNTSLAALSLRFFSCGDFGAKLMAQALLRSTTMVSLNLESNKIGVSGAEALSSYLISQAKSGAPSIRSLRLSYNCILNEGAIALAEALTTSTTLLDLGLKNNKIGMDGLMAIGNALFRNNTLESLAVFGNNFDSTSARLFFDVVTQRVPYTGLLLDVGPYEVDATFLVAEA